MSRRVVLFREALAPPARLGDGATGTQLQLLAFTPGAGGELWNVDQPDRVSQVHRSYLAAGADLLTTNTFGGTSFVLAGHGAAARVRELNVAGAPSSPARWPATAPGCSVTSAPSAACSSHLARPSPTRSHSPSARRPPRCSRAAPT